MSEPIPNRGTMRRRAVIGAVVVVALGALAVRYRSELTLDNLVTHETALREFVDRRLVLALVAAFALYVGVTAASLPIATILTLALSWLFGFGRGVALVSFASTTGATVAFLMSRFLLGNWVQSRYADRLARFNEMLDREGAFYLFALRLAPYVPFVVINLVMGLTRIRVRTFWWVSQLGMLPATAVYVSVGANLSGPREIQERGVTGILTWQLAAALVALGLLPLVGRWATKRMRTPQRPLPTDAN
ncbi:MAG: TVP38/TMEM64 family protein [Pirellulales bacterium]